MTHRNRHIRRRRFNQLTAEIIGIKTLRPVHRNQAGGRERSASKGAANTIATGMKGLKMPEAAIRRRRRGGIKERTGKIGIEKQAKESR